MNEKELLQGFFDRYQLSEEAKQVLQTRQELHQIRLELLATLLRGGDISPVLTRIADHKKNSLVVIDTSGKILAHSDPFREEDPVWKKSISCGFCPPEFIEHVQGVRRAHTVAPHEKAFIRYCDSFAIYYLCSRIIVGGQLYGHVFMIQKSPDFSEEAREVIAFIAENLGMNIERREERRLAREMARGSLLADILSGISSEQIDSRMQAEGFCFPALMRIIVVRARYYLPASELTERLTPMLVSLISSARSLYYDQAVVLVAGVPDLHHSADEFASMLEPLCKKEQLSAGISEIFPCIHDMPRYYEQAVRSIALARKLSWEGSVFCYRNCRTYDLLDQIAEPEKLTALVHPALPRLRAYDQEHGTDFYDTLLVYADSGFQQNEAAQALYLHRNTMNYRRHKIEELTGIDLENRTDRFQLTLSFSIERYLIQVSGVSGGRFC